MAMPQQMKLDGIAPTCEAGGHSRVGFLPPAVSAIDLAVFAILAGMLATFTLGYNYGVNNHIELLLPVMRMMDSRFCLADFTVDAIAKPHEVRFYYSWLCAWLAQVLSLPGAMLVMTLAQNIGMALITAFAARDLHGRETAAPLVAVALLLALGSIELGGATFLRQNYAWPANLSLVAAMFALWQGIRQRPARGAMYAMLATLIHPLVGLEIGGLALAICGLSAGLDATLTPAGRCRMALRALGALCGLGLFGILAWGSAQRLNYLDTRSFLDIYAWFRVPHHILPSMFPAQDYLAALSFLVAAGLSWREWRRTDAGCGPWDRGMLIGTGIVLILLFCGWFMVEVMPSRLWATLQTFRLLSVVKWFGFLLFAGTIARAWASKNPGGRAMGWLLCVPIGPAQPHAALWAQVLGRIVLRISATRTRWAVWPVVVAGYAGTAWLVATRGSPQSPFEAFTLAGILPLIGLFWFCRPQTLRYGLATLWTAGLMGLLICGRMHSIPACGAWIGRFKPVITLSDASEPGDGVAWFCREQLPADAIVLTPPLMGRFRLVAERSIMVDFKCPTTSDATLIEWRRRMADCYGPVQDVGWAAALEMDRSYAQITDRRLAELASIYGLTHAVLYRQTPTARPTLYEDEHYRLVRLPGRSVEAMDGRRGEPSVSDPDRLDGGDANAAPRN